MKNGIAVVVTRNCSNCGNKKPVLDSGECYNGIYPPFGEGCWKPNTMPTHDGTPCKQCLFYHVNPGKDARCIFNDVILSMEFTILTRECEYFVRKEDILIMKDLAREYNNLMDAEARNYIKNLIIYHFGFTMT